MGRFSACFLLTLISQSIIPDSIARADDAARHRFSAEYPAASQKLQEFYTNLQMWATQTEMDREKDQATLVKETEYGGNSGSQVLVSQYMDLQKLAPKYKDSGLSTVHVVDAELSFSLSKKSTSSDYSITWMGSGPPESLQHLVETIRLNSEARTAPYCIFEITLLDFINEKYFYAKDVRAVDGAGSKTIRVEWENPVSEDTRRRGWFDFAPDAGWVLRGYEFSFGTKDQETGKWSYGGVQHGRLEYSGESDGIPLIKRVETWNSGPEGRSPITTITEVTKLKLEPAPRRVFTLEAYGIQTATATDAIPAMYYLLALAALCGLLALVFRVLQKRSARSTTSA